MLSLQAHLWPGWVEGVVEMRTVLLPNEDLPPGGRLGPLVEKCSVSKGGDLVREFGPVVGFVALG